MRCLGRTSIFILTILGSLQGKKPADEVSSEEEDSDEEESSEEETVAAKPATKAAAAKVLHEVSSKILHLQCKKIPALRSLCNYDKSAFTRTLVPIFNRCCLLRSRKKAVKKKKAVMRCASAHMFSDGNVTPGSYPDQLVLASANKA